MSKLDNGGTPDGRRAAARTALALTLRTSLAAVRGAVVTALADGTTHDPEGMRETLLLISQEVDKLWSKVNEVLDAAVPAVAPPETRTEERGQVAMLPQAAVPSLGPTATRRAEFIGKVSHKGKRTRVIVVDDEPSMQSYLRRSLDEAGFEPFVARDPDEAVSLVDLEEPDLVLLDLHLAGASGFDVLKRIRKMADVPVIMLTVSDRDEDTVRALTLGADDFMTKPFSLLELLARMEAVLRRRAFPDVLQAKRDFVLRELCIKFREREVLLHGRRVELTPTEYKLLRELADQAGRVMTFDELLRRVWGPEYLGEAPLVRAQVRNLRKKLGDDGANPTYILNEHGVGYRMPRPE